MSNFCLKSRLIICFMACYVFIVPMETGCANEKESPNPANTNMTNNITTAADELTKLGYLQLFQGSNDNNIERLWNKYGGKKTFTSIISSGSASDLAKFLATELVLYKDKNSHLPDKQQLARIYALALQRNYTMVANTWGVPGNLDGMAGEHFVMLGEAAIPELVTLLSNETRVHYEGSHEATLGDSYQFRVKDLAAFYISEIKSVPFTVDIDPKKRDLEIVSLKKSLEKVERK